MLLAAIIVAIAVDVVIGADKLLLVHVLWRHGERSPINTCKGDANQECIWPQGWDQLTPAGMEEHVNLGSLLYKRYVIDTAFVDKQYQSRQVYVRAGDHNTTLMSAISNFIGFYQASSNASVGTNFPNISKWPNNYVPVPIHTVNFPNDHVENPKAQCARQQWLYNVVKQTPEYRQLANDAQPVLKKASAACMQEISLNDMWIYRDAFQVEHKKGLKIPVSHRTLHDMIYYNDRLNELQNGLNVSQYDGIDFKFEIAKIRGGNILWDIINRCSKKIYCTKLENTNKSDCAWFNQLRYYTYSTSDKTLYALLTTIGAGEQVLGFDGEYPAYASAILIELWNTIEGPALKLLYHRNFTLNSVEDITGITRGCVPTNPYCSFSKFRESAKSFNPGDIKQLCEDTSSKWTYFDPDPSVAVQPTLTAVAIFAIAFIHYLI